MWDAVEAFEFSRKHTTNVHEALGEIRGVIDTLVARRDERRDGFVKVIQKAMSTQLGTGAEQVAAELAKHGVTKMVANQALEIAEREGRFTVFALVDALTRLAGKVVNAGDRTEADQLAASLLQLAA